MAEIKTLTKKDVVAGELVADKMTEGIVEVSHGHNGVVIGESDGFVAIQFPAGDEIRNSLLNHLVSILQQLQRFEESSAVFNHVVNR